MKKLIFILLFVPLSYADDYPLKDGKPTSKGIEQYIEDKADDLVREFQDFIGDTLYNVWIYAENLMQYEIHDSLELGRYFPNEIMITTEELFLAYELADLTRSQRASITETNKFVKSTVFHELTHEYINQIRLEMLHIDNINVHKAYQTYIWILRSHETFGSVFIEEGICEYMSEKMGEIISPKNVPMPKSVEDLTKKENKYWINYKYASLFVKRFLDLNGLKRGIKIFLYNPPPTYDELLNPELYYNRLIVPEEVNFKN